MLFFWLLSLVEVLICHCFSDSRLGSVAVRNSMIVSSVASCQVPLGSVMLKPACMRVAAAVFSASLFLVR